MSLISKALLLDSHDRLRVCISEMSIVFDNILYKIWFQFEPGLGV